MYNNPNLNWNVLLTCTCTCKGGLPREYRASGRFSVEAVYTVNDTINDHTGVVEFPEIPAWHGQLWRGRGVDAAVGVSNINHTEHPRGSCENPRLVMMGEGWEREVKESCGWDWQDPKPSNIRQRIGERTHEDVFSFAREDVGVELEERVISSLTL